MLRLIALVAVLLAATATETRGTEAVAADPPPVPCDSAAIARVIAAALPPGPVAVPDDPAQAAMEEQYCGPNAAARLRSTDKVAVETPGGKIDARTNYSTRELCEGMRRYLRSLPPGETMGWHIMMTGMKEGLLEGARALDWTLGRQLHMTSIEGAQPNARVTEVPRCDDRVVFVNRRVLEFALVARQELAVLYGFEERSGKAAAPPSRERTLSFVRDPDVRARYERHALSLLRVAEPSSAAAPSATAEPNELASAVGMAAWWFLLSHEMAHVARGHVGELVSATESGSADPPLAGEITYRWAQELEADYYATQLVARLGKEWDPMEDASRRLLRWTPLMLLADFESLDYLQRLRQSPGAPPPWPDTRAEESALRAELGGLPASPGTDDFAAVLAGYDPGRWPGRRHPPEHVRAEVVRLALLRARAITAEEYAAFSPADAWRLGLRSLYGQSAPGLGAAVQARR